MADINFVLFILISKGTKSDNIFKWLSCDGEMPPCQLPRCHIHFKYLNECAEACVKCSILDFSITCHLLL